MKFAQKIYIAIIAVLIVSISFTPARSQSISDWFRKNTGGSSSSKSGTGSLTGSEITQGLKEALKVGANNASKQLSAKDGFLKNAAIKILLPKEVQQVEQTLRSVGMGKLVDDAVLSLNRAAEDASKKAAPIFVNAITSMSIQDGVNILKGGDNAATNYLKSKTTTTLTAAFRPEIQASLNKVGAVDMWRKVFDTYNSLPLVRNKVNSDLVAYVTGKALDGLFHTIAIEEAKIRKDPAAQVSNILRKVFGSLK